jgi:hypothetical protein
MNHSEQKFMKLFHTAFFSTATGTVYIHCSNKQRQKKPIQKLNGRPRKMPILSTSLSYKKSIKIILAQNIYYTGFIGM